MRNVLINTLLYAMKTKLIFTLLLGLLSSSAISSGAWGPDLIEFDLEGGTKKETMLWVSGFSYSTTEMLRGAGCLKGQLYLGSKELIGALNRAFSGQQITSEAAAAELGRYIRSQYACAAYNKKLQPIADAPAE